MLVSSNTLVQVLMQIAVENRLSELGYNRKQS